jgi:guanylate kinase
MSNHFFGSYYGFEKRAVERIYDNGRIPATVIFTPIVQQYLMAYPNSLSIFLLPNPNSFDFLRERMLRRGDIPEKVDSRMIGIIKEMQCYWGGMDRYYDRSFIIDSDQDITPVVQVVLNCFKEGLIH